tara:strand:- start:205 stop:612 length:408 start_codon:yes stop_codon:yes gene_type:complete
MSANLNKKFGILKSFLEENPKLLQKLNDNNETVESALEYANYYFNEISIPTILRPVIPFATGLAYLPQALGSKTFIEKQLGFKGMDVPPKIARKAYFEMLFRPKHFGAQLCAYQKAVGGKVVDRVLSQYKINSPK